MNQFAEWDSFYVIVGSAAGALIGLQFVVMTLIAEKPVRDMQRAGAAFATPTIVHFSAVLLVSALMRVPWPGALFAAIAWGLTGACGLLYTALVGRRMVRQTAYRPAFEDWLFHLVLPLTSYALLGAASYEAGAHMLVALFAVAGYALLLLFVGIHNAWDAVAYHVFSNIHGSSNERHKKDARTEKK
jgi:hypothetical protein